MPNDFFNHDSPIARHTLARSSAVNAIATAIEGGFDKLPDEVTLNQGKVNFAVDTGAADAYVVAMPQTWTSYANGATILVEIGAGNTNTGACTINVDGLGARAIKTFAGADPAAGDLTAGRAHFLVYDSANTRFNMVSFASQDTVNIGTVATNIASVNTVAGIDSDVTTVAGISANVTTVAGVSANVTTVAGISGDVTTVAGNSANVTTVAGVSGNVTTVANNIANVNTVAGISGNVTTVAGIAADVTTVANDGTDIGTVATNIANVNTVAGVSGNVTTVAGISANVTTVAGISADVSTVAGMSGDVSAFAARYRIAAAAPTTDLDAGDLYFNTTDNSLYVYTGAAWSPAVFDTADALLQGNNLSDVADVATSRSNLGLGDAATHTVQTSSIDTTEDRVMLVGAFGWGENSSVEISNLDTNGTPGNHAAYGGGHASATPGTSPFPALNDRMSILQCGISEGTSAEYNWQLAVNLAFQDLRFRSKTTGAYSDWFRMYHANNIIGTVSQNADTKIIERGSNTNGEYTKFADGTMICSHLVSTLSTTANTTWTFPAAFSAQPTGLSIVPAVTNARCPAIATLAASSVGFNLYDTAGTRTNHPCRLTAIGRWF